MDRFWHGTLGRPYRLACPVDQGVGTPVVLLHGIGVSHRVWRFVVQLLAGQPYRILAFDLLGFGDSPKPDWLSYTVDDHARAIIASLRRKHLGQPVVLVGHSMGSLVAVRVARLRPDLVARLIVYEMPLYEGLPSRRHYKIRRDLYYKLYNAILNSPELVDVTRRSLRKLIARLAGLQITPELWIPFTRSLEHTIMRQTTLADIKQLRLPIDIIYGSLDMVVIRGRPRKIFGPESKHVTTYTITQQHTISWRASKFLVRRIIAATP